MISAAIVGGTGYTGIELIRLLSAHSEVSIDLLTSRSEAGTRAGRGVRDDHQARRTDAAHHAGADADHGAGGGAERRDQRAAGRPRGRPWRARSCPGWRRPGSTR